jgi:methyl-accepting chemotaxis protein
MPGMNLFSLSADLTLNDNMFIKGIISADKAFSDFAGNVQTALANIETAISRTALFNENIARSLSEAGDIYARTSDGIEQVGQSAENASKGVLNFKDAISSATIAGLAVEGIKKVFSEIASTTDEAVKRFDILNRFPLVMEGFGFSAEQAAASIAKMDKEIRGFRSISTLA